jgi:hypothetical protein
MMANIVVEFVLKGGPVMYPILVCALVAVAVVGERTFWWLRESPAAAIPKSSKKSWPRWKTGTCPPPPKSPKARRPGHPHDPYAG